MNLPVLHNIQINHELLILFTVKVLHLYPCLLVFAVCEGFLICSQLHFMTFLLKSFLIIFKSGMFSNIKSHPVNTETKKCLHIKYWGGVDWGRGVCINNYYSDIILNTLQ